jgi:hypothetical protein
MPNNFVYRVPSALLTKFFDYFITFEGERSDIHNY